MVLAQDEIWALKCMGRENAHDTEDRRIALVDTLIEAGLARIERHYFSSWGGRLHKVREVTLSERGLEALKETKNV